MKNSNKPIIQLSCQELPYIFGGKSIGYYLGKAFGHMLRTLVDKIRKKELEESTCKGP